MFTQVLDHPLSTQIPRLLPVVRELPADLDTPVSIYLKLAGAGPSFLLESVTGGEQVARYSFIGVDPSRSFLLRGRIIEERGASEVELHSLDAGQDPLSFLRGKLSTGGARAGERSAALHGRAGGLPGL